MNIQNIHIYKKNTKISLNTNLLKKFNSINLHLYTHVYLYYYQYILLYNNHLLYIYLFSILLKYRRERYRTLHKKYLNIKVSKGTFTLYFD